MLSKSMFSQEYIRQLHAWTGYDPQLQERVIYAFGLLEAIKLAGLPFCFKGGTSMMLLLDHPRRLSTDIDIIVEPNTDIDEYISYAGTIFPFERVVETHRAVKGSLQKRHFRFTYKSPENGRDVTILLDVLFENILYETVREYPIIRNELLITDGEDLSVLAPNANGLLADKLTAFAPHTTGIPLGIGKDLEVIKQLFDCGVLFEAMDNFHEVCSSYERIAKTEILYRDLKIQPEDILKDTIRSCLCIASRGQYHKEEYVYFRNGISRIRNHIIGNRFSGEIAGSYASRIMYLASSMITGKEIHPVSDEDESSYCLNSVLSKPRSFSYLRFADKAAYEYIISATRILDEAEMRYLVNDLQDKPEGLDVSVFPTGSVSGLPMALHPYG